MLEQPAEVPIAAVIRNRFFSYTRSWDSETNAMCLRSWAKCVEPVALLVCLIIRFYIKSLSIYSIWWCKCKWGLNHRYSRADFLIICNRYNFSWETNVLEQHLASSVYCMKMSPGSSESFGYAAIFRRLTSYRNNGSHFVSLWHKLLAHPSFKDVNDLN